MFDWNFQNNLHLYDILVNSIPCCDVYSHFGASGMPRHVQIPPKIRFWTITLSKIVRLSWNYQVTFFFWQIFIPRHAQNMLDVAYIEILNKYRTFYLMSILYLRAGPYSFYLFFTKNALFWPFLARNLAAQVPKEIFQGLISFVNYIY